MPTDPARSEVTDCYFDEVFDAEPDTTPIGNRTIWLPSQYLDSRRVQLTMEHHAGKLAYHKFDRIITYWKQSGGDLSSLIRGALGQSMVDHLDILVRNAFIGAPFAIYAGTASTMADLGAGDIYDPSDGQKVWKYMANRNVPFANDPSGVGSQSLIAISTPTVIFDIQNHENSSLWKSVMQYSKPEWALKYEVGAWTGVRYLQTVRNVLFNCGVIVSQTQLAVAITPGDGAAATVDAVYTVGQASGVTRYITVDDESAFSVGDILTIHKTRTNSYGVTNGVDPTEGTMRHRRVISLDAGNHRIAFDKPFLDSFDIDDYVTLARDVQMTAFVAGPAIAAGIAQAPQVYAPGPVDDLQAIYRFTWDAYLKYQLYRVEFGEAIYSAGTGHNEWQD